MISGCPSFYHLTNANMVLGGYIFLSYQIRINLVNSLPPSSLWVCATSLFLVPTKTYHVQDEPWRWLGTGQATKAD